ASDHPVALCDLVLDRDSQVREGGTVRGCHLLGCVRTVCSRKRVLRVVVDGVGADKLIELVQLSGVENLQRTAGDRLVLVRHVSPPLGSDAPILRPAGRYRQVRLRGCRLAQAAEFSTTIARPWPTPMHMVARP